MKNEERVREMQALEQKRKKAGFIWIAGAVIVLLLLGLLISRVIIWSRDRQETRLLVLVNDWNSIESANFKVKLRTLPCGVEVDSHCAADLGQMLSDCSADGCSPHLLRGYVSREEQEKLYRNEYGKYLDQGKTSDEAMALTVRKIPRPGRSEHELGLSVDIVDSEYRETDEKQGETATSKWLHENSWRYGFIERYPEGTENVTGMMPRPWHYRYVGRKAAEQIKELNICLEEYVQMFFTEKAVIVYGK